MGMFDYMVDAIKGKKKAPDVVAPTAEEAALAAVKERLKKIVYDDNVVDQLAPLFSKLGDEYAPVWELLEAKEAMLSEVSEDLFTQESTPKASDTSTAAKKDDGDDTVQSAEDILRAKYGA